MVWKRIAFECIFYQLISVLFQITDENQFGNFKLMCLIQFYTAINSIEYALEIPIDREYMLLYVLTMFQSFYVCMCMCVSCLDILLLLHFSGLHNSLCISNHVPFLFTFSTRIYHIMQETFPVNTTKCQINIFKSESSLHSNL